MKRSTTRRSWAARHEMQDDFGVGGRLEDGAVANQFAAQAVGVGEVAVVGEGEAADSQIGEQRLDVAQMGRRHGWSSGRGRWRCCLAGGR